MIACHLHLYNTLYNPSITVMVGFLDRTWKGYLAYWSSTVGSDSIGYVHCWILDLVLDRTIRGHRRSERAAYIPIHTEYGPQPRSFTQLLSAHRAWRCVRRWSTVKTAGLQPLLSAQSTQRIAADSWARLPCICRRLNATQCVRQRSRTTHDVSLDTHRRQESWRLYWLSLSSVIITPSMHMHPDTDVCLPKCMCSSVLLMCCSVLRTEVTEPVRSLVTSVLKKGPKWPKTEVTKDRTDHTPKNMTICLVIKTMLLD